MTSPASVAPVTVVVPCLNEELGLPQLIERLRGLRRNPAAADWHVVMVDDGSTDETFAMLLRAERDEPWIEVLRHRENLGLGAALRTAFAHVASPIVCTMDSDCTYPPERLPELVDCVNQGADIATASAWHPHTMMADASGIRFLLSRSVSRLYKIMIAQDIHTFTCLFRAYRRTIITGVPFYGDGFGAVAELMLRAMLAGYRIAEVPMALERRRFGESKLKTLDAITAHLSLLTMTAFLTSINGGRGHAPTEREPAQSLEL